MDAITRKSCLGGTVFVPASKSHTIRGVLIAALADGESVLHRPLDSLDTRSAVDAVSSFGAVVRTDCEKWVIRGVDGHPRVPDNVIDVGNSGTTLYLIMGTAALVDGWTVLTGDSQIRRRTAAPLINALRRLDVNVFSTKGDGTSPIAVRGPLGGGSTSVEGVSSQYLSSLLLACPLASGDTDIEVPLLNERPYVLMTLDWLARQDIHPAYNDSFSSFRISGNARYHSFEREIPADFSSAAFPICAGVLAGGTVTLNGLDMNDTQGDKAIIDMLRSMGADIESHPDGITVRGGSLKGVEIDMNAVPDALPAMAVCACFAEGTTILDNVPQARFKETDRIHVMAQELSRLGTDISELPDGLVIRGGGLGGGRVDGHGDHRVVMALTVAGFASDGPITVSSAEAADVTYSGFWDAMRGLGGDIELRSH